MHASAQLIRQVVPQKPPSHSAEQHSASPWQPWPRSLQALSGVTQVAGLPSHKRPLQQSPGSAQPPPAATHMALQSWLPSPPVTQEPRQQSPLAVQGAPLARQGPGPSSQRSSVHTLEQQGSPPPLVQLSPVARQGTAASC
jgi:hypothetical protein